MTKKRPLALFLALGFSSLFAGNDFLLMTAPAAASGRAGTGVAGYSFAESGLNPAALAGAERPAIRILFAPYASDLSFQSFAFVYPFREFRIGISGDLLGLSPIPETEGGIPTDNTLGYHDLALALHAAIGLKDSHFFGAAGRFINRRIADLMANAFAFDAGYVFRAVFLNFSSAGKTKKNLSCGIALRNAGTPIRFVNQSDSLPLLISAGISYQPVGPIRIYADSEWTRSETTIRPRVGAEFIHPFGISLRAGASALDRRAVFSAGIGIRQKILERVFSLDYSLEPFNNTDLSHRFTLSLGW